MNELNIYQIIFDAITVTSVIFGIMSTFVVIVRFIQAATYNKTDKILDQAKGVIRTFPVLKPIIIMVLCWAWIISIIINS